MNLTIYPAATLHSVWSGPLLSMWDIFLKRLNAKVDLHINNPGEDFKEVPRLSLKSMRRKHRRMVEEFAKERIFYIRKEMEVVEEVTLYARTLDLDCNSPFVEDSLIPIMDMHTMITHLPQKELGEQCERFSDMVFNRIRLMMALLGNQTVAKELPTGMYEDFRDSLFMMMDHFVRSPGSDNTLAFLYKNVGKVHDVQLQSMLKEMVSRSIVYRNAIIMPTTGGLISADRILPGAGRLYDRPAPEAAKEVFLRSVKALTKTASKGTGMNAFDILPTLLEYQAFSPVQLYIDGA